MEGLKNYINSICYTSICGDYLLSEWIPYKIENEPKFKALSKEYKTKDFNLNINDVKKVFRLESKVYAEHIEPY